MNVQFGPYEFKRQERILSGPDGPIDLSARSFDILCVLLGKPSEVVSKSELLDAVWPGVVVEENTLQVHISALRKALDPNMIVTVHGRGYKYAGPVPERPTISASVPTVQDRKPVITVLPFHNLSGDQDQQYFSDGITADITDRLSRYRMLSVIGHDSAFAFRNGDMQLANVRSRLSADYAVLGNVRRSGNRIRVAARLVDLRTENAIWADHYDRPLEDIFAVQDDVAAIIASTLVGRVELDVGTRGKAIETQLTSHELVLQGIWHFKKLTIEGNEIAAQHFRKALSINPLNAEAMRWLSSYHINRWFMVHDRSSLAQSVELGRKAAELDPTSALCHTAHGFAQMWAEGIDAAEASYRKALQANPSDPNVLVEVALLNVYSGNLGAAHDFFDRAEQLNPLPPLWYAEFRAVAAFAEGRYNDALSGFAALPECVFGASYLLACLGHLGIETEDFPLLRLAKAQGLDLEAVAADEPFLHPEPRQRLVDGIRKAIGAGR